MRHIPLSLAIMMLVLSPTIVLADSAAPTKPAGAVDPATAAKPAPTPGAELPENTRSALKLAGLVTFVANSCPALKPDYARFKAALGALGLSLDDLSKSDLKVVYIGYASRYGADIPANCERARLAFGAKGTTIPDLFVLH